MGLRGLGTNIYYAFGVSEPDMATKGGDGPNVQKGDRGRPSMVQWQLQDRESDDNNSPMATMNGAFGGSPIFFFFYGHLLIAHQQFDQYRTSDTMNLPVQVQASRERRCESTGRCEIATREGRARALSAQPNAEGEDKCSRSRRSL